MKRYHDIIRSSQLPHEGDEYRSTQTFYVASIGAMKDGGLNVATKSFLARDNREAGEIASRLCEKEYPPGRGYHGHFSVAGPVHEGPRRGSDGEIYNLLIEPV